MQNLLSSLVPKDGAKRWLSAERRVSFDCYAYTYAEFVEFFGPKDAAEYWNSLVVSENASSDKTSASSSTDIAAEPTKTSSAAQPADIWHSDVQPADSQTFSTVLNSLLKLLVQC